MGATNTAYLAIYKPDCNISSSQDTEYWKRVDSRRAHLLSAEPRSSWNISRWNSVLEEGGFFKVSQHLLFCLPNSAAAEITINHNFETGDLLSTSVDPEWVAPILST